MENKLFSRIYDTVTNTDYQHDGNVCSDKLYSLLSDVSVKFLLWTSNVSFSEILYFRDLDIASNPQILFNYFVNNVYGKDK